MGPPYAAALGMLAFATVVLQGVLYDNPVEETLPHALFCLFTFAAIGALAGSVASRLVSESVAKRFVAELKARQQSSDSTSQ